MTDFKWTNRSEEAAELVAEANLSFSEIAERADVTRQMLWVWRQHPDFAARVDGHRAMFRAAVRDRGIAIVEKRLAALNDRWGRLQRVIQERADDPTMEGVPGGKTGLMVRTIKRVVIESDSEGTPTSREVEEFAVDTGLLKELREHEKQAAQELGQWTENVRVDHAVKTYAVENTPDVL